MKINRRRAEWRAASLPLSHVFVRDVRLHPADLLHRLLLLLLLVFRIHQNHQFLGGERGGEIVRKNNKKKNWIVDFKFKREKKAPLRDTLHLPKLWDEIFQNLLCPLKNKKTKLDESTRTNLDFWIETFEGEASVSQVLTRNKTLLLHNQVSDQTQ